MKYVVVIVALLVACKDKGTTPPSPRDGMLTLPVAQVVAGKRATIPKIAPRVGEVITRKKVIQIRGLATGGSTFDVDDRGMRTFEVLAVEDGVVTSARVTYPEETFEKRVSGAKQPWAPVLRGNTYLLTMSGDEVVIARDGMTPEEETLVLADVGADIGPAEEALSPALGVPLESGRVVPLSAATLSEQFGGAATVTSAEARLLDVRGEIAVVEIAYRGTTADQQFESREVSEWSTKTGRQLSTTAAAAFHNEKFANRVDGSHTYEYR